MSILIEYLYAKALYDEGGTRTRSGGAADIDDPYDAPDFRVTYLKQTVPSVAGETGWARFTLTAPRPGVTINWIRAHYILWTESASGGPDAEQVFAGAISPNLSANHYTSTSRTIVDAGGRLIASGAHAVTNFPHYNINTGGWNYGAGGGPAHAYWQYDVDPSDGLPWTVAKLQNLLANFTFDATKGTPNALFNLTYQTVGSNPRIGLTSLYVEVNENVATASIEEKRLLISAHLRLFREALDIVTWKLPPAAADNDIGDIVALSHGLGPSADGLGWGPRPWERRYGYVLEKDVAATGDKTVLLTVLDVTRFVCGLWFPAISDLPYTEEGQGVPYLDAGGGRTVTRSTVAYVKCQAADSLYVQVAANKEKWTPLGLAAEDPYLSGLLNDSFSVAGAPHASWTNSTSGGGAVGATTSDFLFDISGLRRACTLSSSAGASNFAGVYQAFTPAGSAYMRAHIFSKSTAVPYPANHLYRVQRGSDGWYWNDAAGAFENGVRSNPLNTSSTTAPCETYSKPFPCVAGVAYTLYVYVIEGSGSGYPGNQAVTVYYAALYFNAVNGCDFVPTPIVTTNATVASASDRIVVANPPSAISLDIVRGTGLLKARIAWDHAWMPDSYGHTFIYGGADAEEPSFLEGVYYRRISATEGRFEFFRYWLGVSLGAAITVTNVSGPGGTSELPQCGDLLKIGWRWQRTDGELGLPDNAAGILVSGLRGGTTVKTAIGTVPLALLPSVPIILGAPALAIEPSWRLCGTLRDVEVVPYVLSFDEICRRLGI